MIREASIENERDAGAIVGIYNHYIENTIITFEETPVTANEMRSRISETVNGGFPWLVWEQEDEGVVGYAYAGIWKGRCAYRHSMETTVYLDPAVTGGGIGTQLYRSLLERLDDLSVHAVMGGIALPNTASIALHEKLGFSQVAHFKELGRKFGKWIDVGYWQRLG